jgi:hypothetical protein
MSQTVTDKREAMANQLLMRGHATMMELLVASFGEWPPRGLEVNPLLRHGQSVRLKEIHDSGKRAGGASDTEERVVVINKDLCEQFAPLYQFLGHEALHILQGDHSFRMKKDLLGRIADFFTDRDDPASEAIMERLTSRPENPFRNQFNAATANIPPHESRMLYYMHHKALRRGSEIQARLHQIIIEGYPRWGKVPATTDEFYAAMKNAGFRLPVEIVKDLEECSGLGQFLNGGIGTCREKVREVETVVNSLTKDSQREFWGKTALELYADLIEMYGDVPGRARFGMGENPKAKVSFKNFPGQNK